MPIYEYACHRCDHEFEKLQKISDAPLTDCPACGEATLKKKVSAAAFRLKGSGWYETDFKKNQQKNLAKGDGDSKAEAGGDNSGAAKENTSAKSDSATKSEKAPAKSDSAANSSAA